MHSQQSEGEVISLLSLSEALASVLAVSGVVGGLIQSLFILLLALEEKKGGGHIHIVRIIAHFTL
jgi:hypothetical protein